MDSESIQRTIEELQLIQCFLLPSEYMTFIDDDQGWRNTLDKYSEEPDAPFPSFNVMPSIAISADDAAIWFELTLGEDSSDSFVSVKGDITRKDQERWQSIVSTKIKQITISDSEFPNYQLVSLHLLPLLHEDIRASAPQKSDSSYGNDVSKLRKSQSFHALFTSHHLISPTKRRSLQRWSAALRLSGFAKVGHPGVIYAQGDRMHVEEFVNNVKAMQWLALKVRFVEPIPVTTESENANCLTSTSCQWKEFQKVGEVVEEMRSIGREDFVVEMGIGSTGLDAK